MHSSNTHSSACGFENACTQLSSTKDKYKGMHMLPLRQCPHPQRTHAKEEGLTCSHVTNRLWVVCLLLTAPGDMRQTLVPALQAEWQGLRKGPGQQPLVGSSQLLVSATGQWSLLQICVWPLPAGPVW